MSELISIAGKTILTNPDYIIGGVIGCNVAAYVACKLLGKNMTNEERVLGGIASIIGAIAGASVVSNPVRYVPLLVDLSMIVGVPVFTFKLHDSIWNKN